MAIRVGIIQDIKAFSDIRVCHFYLFFLNKICGLPEEPCNRQSTHSCMQAISNIIIRHSPDKNRQSQLLAEAEAACGENILPAAHFDWLKQDERAAFWFWAYIVNMDDNQPGFPPPQSSLADFQTWYGRMNLSRAPHNHDERMALIMRYFDGIYIPPSHSLKQHKLEQLKEKWQLIYSQPVPLKWLPDEERDVLWAWDAVKKHQDIFTLEAVMKTPGLTTWFIPLSHSERRLAVRAALDLWDDAPDSKRLFLLNLNKAWNQQKLRRSRTGKKALSTYLKNDTRMRLDILAAHYDMRISDVLEKIINEHYRQVIPPAE